MVVQVVEQRDPLAALGQATGTGLSTGLQMLLNDKIQRMQATKLLERGFTPKEASLWQQFTEGGRTHLAKEIVERMQREKSLTDRGFFPTEERPIEAIEEETPVAEVKIEEDIGLTPKEKIRIGEERFKQNVPIIRESQKKLRSLESEGDSLEFLEELNKSDQLPTGLGRLNVNLTSGELRAPFLANAETQSFIKTINDFTTKAKESFGARVTNFELNRFMKRLPSLLNTKDGRKLILRQMRIINDINKINHRSLIDVFKSRGGSRRIDADRAETLAEKRSKPQIEKLRKEYVTLDKQSISQSRPISSKTSLKKVPEGTPLSNEIVDDLLKRSEGDIKKAKETARKLGYEF